MECCNIPGPDNLDNLRKLAEQFQKRAPNAEGSGANAEDDDDVPELVAGETFEAAAEEGQKSEEVKSEEAQKTEEAQKS